MKQSLKIGIIQNAPVTGDFSRNLRAIVQGYRECLDHGARLVVAPATALCGPDVGDLRKRRSFQIQTKAALDALSKELGKTPLLLGAVVPPEPWEEEEDDDDGLRPFVLRQGKVTELEDGDFFDVGRRSVCAAIRNDDGAMDEDSDLCVLLSPEPWQREPEEKKTGWLLRKAQSYETPFVCASPVGLADGKLYSGGSGVYLPSGDVLCQLPCFEACNRVVDLGGAPRTAPLPDEDEEDAQSLLQALRYGIAETVRQHEADGVCLPLDHPNAPLLAAICRDALGPDRVLGLCATSTPDVERAAQALGISLRALPLAPLLQAAGCEQGSALAARLAAALATGLAEEEGRLLLSPLSRHELMLGDFTLYAETCGQLAPLGDLYRSELRSLARHLEGSHGNEGSLLGPSAQPDELDRIVHALADLNVTPAELLASRHRAVEENDVRFVQRRLADASRQRGLLPPMLRLSPPDERPRYPRLHWLND